MRASGDLYRNRVLVDIKAKQTSVAVCPSIAQNAANGSNPTSIQIPRLVRFSGVAKDASGEPMTGVVGIMFSPNKEAQSGAPLSTETQNIQVGPSGHYAVLLGSASAGGVPLALFSSSEVHWIGAHISGQPEQPRVLLLSVLVSLLTIDAASGASRIIKLPIPNATSGSQDVQSLRGFHWSGSGQVLKQGCRSGVVDTSLLGRVDHDEIKPSRLALGAGEAQCQLPSGRPVTIGFVCWKCARSRMPYDTCAWNG